MLYPLTAAIIATYGSRDDGAYPIGAFYTDNVSQTAWEHVSGIWYIPITDVLGRSIRQETIDAFRASIQTGAPVQLRSGTTVTWEAIPDALASQLPTVGT